MARFRSKPTVVEAAQFTGAAGEDPPGVMRLGDIPGDVPYVVTIHKQTCHVEPGDWIITEADPRYHYPCKDAIFRAKYEPVTDPE